MRFSESKQLSAFGLCTIDFSGDEIQCQPTWTKRLFFSKVDQEDIRCMSRIIEEEQCLILITAVGSTLFRVDLVRP